MRWSKSDIRFMRRALALAQKGEGRVSPNPQVGAILVRNGKILSEGFHGKFGAPHAEINAIKKAGKLALGSTLYVTLEPCSHSGNGKKTPPCVPAIIKAGVSRVVIATPDANPQVNGIQELKKAGMNVDAGLLASEAQEQNEAFFHFMRTGFPFVLIKMSQSTDGKIGIRGKSNVRISGREFNLYVHRGRNRYDSILVGINTVLADNPRLTCRIPGGRNPVRIILDDTLQIPPNAKVLARAKKETVIIATTGRRDGNKEKQLRGLGAHILICGKGKVSLRTLLLQLPKFGIISVMIEGGAKTVRSALKEKVVDKIILSISPKQITSPHSVNSPFTPNLMRKLFSRAKKYKLGQEAILEACVRR